MISGSFDLPTSIHSENPKPKSISKKIALRPGDRDEDVSDNQIEVDYLLKNVEIGGGQGKESIAIDAHIFSRGPRVKNVRQIDNRNTSHQMGLFTIVESFGAMDHGNSVSDRLEKGNL